MNPPQQATIALVIPIYNAESDIPLLFDAIKKQTLQPNTILVIDSSSTDNSKFLLEQRQVSVHTIPKAEFDHGGTRQLATRLVSADIYIYLTQDAIPSNEYAFENLIKQLHADDNIGCAYGRQLPKFDATPIAAHARLFNYPVTSVVRSMEDAGTYGIKTCFNSDSFAAYKRSALDAVGGFPSNLITGEDVYVAGKLLKAGFKVGYAANAHVYHSHNLSLLEEFHRYFSIGVLHGKENWITHDFASCDGEGWRFVKSEMQYLVKNKKYTWLVRAGLSTLVKYASYQLGRHEQVLPNFIKHQLGINKAYWRNMNASIAK